MPYNFRNVIIQDISSNVDFWRSSENDNVLVYIHRNSFLELTVTNTNAFWYLDDMGLILIADVCRRPLVLHIFFFIASPIFKSDAKNVCLYLDWIGGPCWILN